jgi:hypothetical protein
MAGHENSIRQFLEHYGAVLSAGNLAQVVACWEVPAFVLADDGAIPVAAEREVLQFFSGAVQAYRSQGLVSTRPELLRLESLGQRVAAVDVRWSARDAAGQEQTSERSRYLLRRGDDEKWHIRVAITVEDDAQSSAP